MSFSYEAMALFPVPPWMHQCLLSVRDWFSIGVGVSRIEGTEETNSRTTGFSRAAETSSRIKTDPWSGMAGENAGLGQAEKGRRLF